MLNLSMISTSLIRTFELRSKSAAARKCPKIGHFSRLAGFIIFEKYEEFADSRETEAINNQVSFYKTDTFIRNKYMTYEFDLHESREEGRKEAEAKALEEKKAMARGFRDDGFPLEAISKRTGFTVEEIKAL